jgi:hypothetical protein
MTSISTQPPATRGDLAFNLEPKKTNGTEPTHSVHPMSCINLHLVTTFNPLLTPSRLLDPKVMERKQKVLAQR